jgi:hypothetical protein
MTLSTMSPIIGFQDLITSPSESSGRYTANRIDDLSEFRRLVSTWRAETYFLPSVREKIENASFRKIIGMGDRVIPWIINEIERTPDFLVMALGFLVPSNPIPDSARGKLYEIVDFWLTWAQRTRPHAD